MGAREALQTVAANRNPASEKKEARQEQEAGGDQNLIFTQFDVLYERHVKPNNTIRAIGEVMRALNKDVQRGRTCAFWTGAT
jgi:hypothetical protein